MPWHGVIRPLVLVWPNALAFWLLLAIAFVPEFRVVRHARARETTDAGQDRGTLRLVLRICSAAFWLALAAAILVPATTITGRRDAVFVVGLGLVGIGSLVRHHCFRTLGAYFVGTVSVQPEQPIVERGAYRWVRHPSYAGAMLLWTGIGLAFTNWVSLALLAVLPAIGYALRVRVEERALVETLGDRYHDYMRRTKRFVPWLV